MFFFSLVVFMPHPAVLSIYLMLFPEIIPGGAWGTILDATDWTGSFTCKAMSYPLYYVSDPHFF